MGKENLSLLDIRLRKLSPSKRKGLKKDSVYHPYSKMYKTTRKQWIAPRSVGNQFTKEIIKVEGEEKVKWHVRNNNFNKFNATQTFFPLYDTDRNSFIRLHRLHRAYKEKKLKVPFQKKENIPNINVFKKCIILMNEQLTEEIIHKGETLKIGRDILEPYITAGKKVIQSNRLPLRMLWTVKNPYPKNSLEYLMYPSHQRLFGRFTFTTIKAKYKELRQDEKFLLRYPLYVETKGYEKKHINKKTLFKDIDDKDLSFNMFNDF